MKRRSTEVSAIEGQREWRERRYISIMVCSNILKTSHSRDDMMIDQSVRDDNTSTAIFQDCQNEDRSAMSPRHTPPSKPSTPQETSNQNVTPLEVTGEPAQSEKETKIARKVERAGNYQAESHEARFTMKVCREIDHR
jgi:hypothetical protein